MNFVGNLYIKLSSKAKSILTNTYIEFVDPYDGFKTLIVFCRKNKQYYIKCEFKENQPGCMENSIIIYGNSNLIYKQIALLNKCVDGYMELGYEGNKMTVFTEQGEEGYDLYDDIVQRDIVYNKVIEGMICFDEKAFKEFKILQVTVLTCVILGKLDDKLVVYKRILDKDDVISSKLEAKILEHLKNIPNVVKIIGYITKDDNILGFVIDFVAGYNLRDFLQKRLYRKQKRFICMQIIDIVRNLHLNNVIHGDLRPENFIINDDYKITIIDFNSSSFIEGDKSDVKLTASINKKYRAPELEDNYEITVQSDLYSLGIMLKEIDEIDYFDLINKLLSTDPSDRSLPP